MTIEIWDNRQLENYIEKTDIKQVSNHLGKKLYEGFKYFGPSFLENIRYREEIISLHRKNVLFESCCQRDSNLDRSVVNLTDSEVTGILTFIYGNFDFDFPHYSAMFIDVREDKRKQGIATSMIKRLNEPSFLSGGNLILSSISYSHLGREYVKPLLEREWTGKQFKIFCEETGVRIK